MATAPPRAPPTSAYVRGRLRRSSLIPRALAATAKLDGFCVHSRVGTCTPWGEGPPSLSPATWSKLQQLTGSRPGDARTSQHAADTCGALPASIFLLHGDALHPLFGGRGRIPGSWSGSDGQIAVATNPSRDRKDELQWRDGKPTWPGAAPPPPGPSLHPDRSPGGFCSDLRFPPCVI